MKNIAVFASGNGSNFKNLIELSEIGYLKGKIKLLITDRECNAKKLALGKNIENIQISKNDDEKLLKAIDEHSIDLIVLAGYLSKIPENLIEKYHGKIINIHPALLPSFGGKGFYGEKVHKSVIEKECKMSGITIHFVDKDYDS
jgi:phosphoribosylglycinamide formyltransferase-1